MSTELNTATVFVIDADSAAREALRGLVREMGLACRVYATGGEFFADFDPRQPGCLILDVRVPSVPGLQIQQQLADTKSPLPLIIISGHGDISLTVEVMRRGAFHYLQKPVRAVEVWEAIRQAIEVDRQRRELQAGKHRLTEALAVLQPREREILRLIAEGADSHSLAQQLGVSVRTIELDRSRVMRKLGLKSSNALLHFALRVHPDRPYAKLLARQNPLENSVPGGANRAAAAVRS